MMNTPDEGFPQDSNGTEPQNQGSATNENGAVKPVTMAVIAKAAGLSQGAVSSLLNHREYGIRVSLDKRDRVFKLCRDLGYVPNDLRAYVRIYPERGDTCLAVSNNVHRGLKNPFVARLAARLMAHGSPQPASIAIMRYDEARDYDVDHDLPSPLKDGTATRTMFVGAANESICRLAHQRALPAFLIGHTTQTPGLTSIVPDYAEASRLALALLVREGHQHIGIIGGPFGDPEPRIGEMSRAIAIIAHEMGLVIEPENVFHGNLDFESGVAAARAMVSHATSPTAPTALLCMTESAAIGAIAAAQSHGIHVPDELSIITFADHAETLDSCLPLTAVILPVEDLAVAAVREADRLLREGIPTAATKIVIPVQLIERSTCGPIKARGRPAHSAQPANPPVG